MKLLIDKYTNMVQTAVTFETPTAPMQPMPNQYVVQVDDGSPDDYVGKIYDSSTNTYTAPAPTYTWDNVRAARDIELQKTDWTQLADAPLTAFQVYEFSEWRQKLRDITEDYTTPTEAMAGLQTLRASKPQ